MLQFVSMPRNRLLPVAISIAMLTHAAPPVAAGTFAASGAAITWEVFGYRQINDTSVDPVDFGGVFVVGDNSLSARAETTGGSDRQISTGVAEFQAFSDFDTTVWEVDVFFNFGASVLVEPTPPDVDVRPGSEASARYEAKQIGGPFSVTFGLATFLPDGTLQDDGFGQEVTLTLGHDEVLQFNVTAAASAVVPVPLPVSALLLGGALAGLVIRGKAAHGPHRLA